MTTIVEAYRGWLRSQGRNVKAYDERKEFAFLRDIHQALPDLQAPSFIQVSGRGGMEHLVFELPQHPALVFVLVIGADFEDVDKGPFNVWVCSRQPGVWGIPQYFQTLKEDALVKRLKVAGLEELYRYQPSAEDIQVVETHQQSRKSSTCVLL